MVSELPDLPTSDGSSIKTQKGNDAKRICGVEEVAFPVNVETESTCPMGAYGPVFIENGNSSQRRTAKL